MGCGMTATSSASCSPSYLGEARTDASDGEETTTLGSCCRGDSYFMKEKGCSPDMQTVLQMR